MPALRSTRKLPATDVHARLRRALNDLRRAERNAILWFAEIQHRKLYRELGYSSIYLYASQALGFSKPRTAQFLRLSDSLEKLPELRKSVASGRIAWTKAREIARVATPRTETQWLTEADQSSRAQLEEKIRRVKARAKARRASARTSAQALAHGDATKQGELLEPGAETATREVGNERQEAGPSSQEMTQPIEIPAGLHLRFEPEQYARYEALMERLRKLGAKQPREELLLAALDELVNALDRERRKSGARRKSPASEITRSSRQASTEFPRGNSATPYRVVLYHCEVCKRSHLPTTRGNLEVNAATLGAILCDARMIDSGKRSRSAVPPGLRARILARDGHRCRMDGCDSTRFLQVHHIDPNGPNDPANLTTLCSACHKLLHERAQANRRHRGKSGMKSRGP